MASYSVVSVDLGTVTPPEGRDLVKPGQYLGELAILAVPSGSSLELALGATADWFTIAAPFTMEPDSDDLANVGLRIRNLVAQPGVVLQLLLVFGRSRLGAQPL